MHLPQIHGSHGCDNFFVTCLHTERDVTIEKLQKLEISYIQDYGSLNTVHSKSEVVIPDKVGSKSKVRRVVFEHEMPDITLDLILEVTNDCDELLSFIELRDRIFEETENMGKVMAEMCTSKKICITKATMEWLGYECKQERDNKATFLQLLKAQNIDFKQIKHNDPTFKDYPELVEEAAHLSTNVLRNQWIIMGSKRMVHKLKTKRSTQIYEYYVALEQLTYLYPEYVDHFQLKQQGTIDDLVKVWER